MSVKVKTIGPLIGLLFALASSVVSAQTLWSGTKLGMSPAQVQTVVPKAVPPTSTPNTIRNGSEVELLRVDGLDLVNETFSASFYFRDDHLSEVMLSLQKDHTFQSAKLVFDSLVEALRAKYGREENHTSQRGILNTEESTWMSGRTNISVYLTSVADTPAVLNVIYQVRVANEADKL